MTVHMTREELLALREDSDFEAKAAQGRDGKGEVPQNVWETYAAMANTDGGRILLGAKEEADGNLAPLGLGDPAKVRKTLWDNLNNKQIVNVNLLSDRDITVVECEGVERPMILLHVPRASRRQRPVYLGGNPLTGTYRRGYEGDYRCDEATVRRMLAEAVEETRDAAILPDFSFDDLAPETLAAYRNEFRSTRPGHPWIALDDRDFLHQLGGWGRDRQTRQEGLTLAGLLMFGRLRSILDTVPEYIVDYREKTSADPGIRWDDRITTDGTWSGNLFDFYRRVYPRLVRDLRVPFRLEHSAKRIDESEVHEALREAFVNTLIHADYSGGDGILVTKLPDRFIFRNPGGLRLPIPLVLEGGTSDCRNRNLQKMFQLVGAGEQAGSGYPKILRAWREQHWRTPLLREETDPERTTLQLPMVSLLPQDALEQLNALFGSGFRSLEEVGRLALATALIEGRVTNERLRELTNMHPSDLTIVLRSLVDRGFLLRRGASNRGAYYELPPQPYDQVPLEVTPTGESFQPPPSSFQPGKLSFQPGKPEPQLSVFSPEDTRQPDDQVQPFEPLAAAIRSKDRVSREVMEDAIRKLCQHRWISLRELANSLGRSPETLRVHYLEPMVQRGEIEMRYPTKARHPKQAYRTRTGT